MPTAEGRDNVVPLPRDWLGPREDLVPLGPRAPAQEAAAEPAYGADDFWGENSSSLHGVVRTPDAHDEHPEAAPPVAETSRHPRSHRLVPAALLLLAVLAAIAIGRGISAHGPARVTATQRAGSMVFIAGLTTADRTVASDLTRLGRRRVALPRRHHAHPAVSRRVRRAPRPANRVLASSNGTSTENAAVTQRSPAPSYLPPTGVSSSTGGASTGSSGGGSSSSSASSNQAPFGANGTLGPGSSPNG